MSDAPDTNAVIDALLDVAAGHIENLERQLTAMREALARMVDTHGAHGPCRNNSCSDCRDALVKARAALAETEKP